MPSHTRTSAAARGPLGALTARTARTRRDQRVELGAAPGDLLVLGRYRLHRPLGAGGFGTVWLARDERLERDVAVKVLPRERIVGGRFEREARAAARLSHPGIVTLYEAAVDDEGAYLVSELVRGATFAQLVEAGRLSDRDVVEIGVALCDALGHAHAQGVVHRDVKPSNVLVPEHPSSASQVAKLTDFGVARVIGGDTLTRTGDVIGTAAYMAPEQAEGREAGASADLYSLALVLYEALTGVNPLASGAASQRARRLGAHLPPLRRQRRELPRELGRSIDLALRPRPRERGSIDELRGGLIGSLEEADDRPGVVESPWPTRSRGLPGHDAPPQSHFAEPPEAFDHPPRPRGTAAAEAGEWRERLRWPERGFAALGAAGIALWLAGYAFTSPPVAPAAAALLTGIAVATRPRLGWFALAMTGTGSLAISGRDGAALLVLLGALLPVVLLFRRPARWSLAAAAPALGVVGLAGAWPALAARGRGVWQRVALGAVGWIWLQLAGLIGGHGLYTQLPRGTPPGTTWMPSLHQTVVHVLAPLLSSGCLAVAPIWGSAAAILPWLTTRSLPTSIVLVSVWSAALASATGAVLRAVGPGVQLEPNALIIGAVVAGIVAVAPAITRVWRSPAGSSDTEAGLA